ncbi:pyridoxal-phosphate dependent enzyme [Microbulbifer magnicolonia]|uniref:pyridoxal-phosphate dependent enzyme n=1 Tax=Microbulbifer magnicolonia TaxID=3109744 RepID=UPI002B4059D7|nr:pyridoxal-phosphate dependent enzyme [Microbulbifer sp. GG15]
MKPRYLTSLDLDAFIEAAREVPYQRIDSDLFPNIEVWIRRDDLLDPIISGNKAYKLLFNLIEAKEQGADTLITCGGAWSNHIHATAAAGARFGFRTIGIIRGECPPVLSATLLDAERFGMQLRFVTREQYRLRNQSEFLKLLGLEQESALYIPEGGANLAGARGTQLLGKVIEATAPIRFDQLWLACGTGLTLAGLVSSITNLPVCGVEVLKAGNSIRYDAQRWLEALNSPSPVCGRGVGERATSATTRNQVKHSADLYLNNKYHCGGYAKYPEYLQKFQRAFEHQSGIPLDPLYTAKLMYGLHQEATAGRIPPGSKILTLHSGGLQGRRGFPPAVMYKK